MFTVKFIRFAHANQKGDYQVSISCPKYSSFHRPCGSFTITTYKDHTNIDGIDWQISPENVALDSDFDVCFVENQTGKTIETYRPTKEAR